MCRVGNLISSIPTLPNNNGAMVAVAFRSMKILSSGSRYALRDRNCSSSQSFLNLSRSWNGVNPAHGESGCHISLVGLVASSPIHKFRATQRRKNPMLPCEGGILSMLRRTVCLRGLLWTSVPERGFQDRLLGGQVVSVKDDLDNLSTSVSSSLSDEILLEGNGENHEEDGFESSIEGDAMEKGEMQSGEYDYRLWGSKPRTKCTSELIQSIFHEGQRSGYQFVFCLPHLLQEKLKSGLYLVATPIGNLEDITIRALRTLKSATCILAEDTRHSSKLLQHYGISTPTMSYHKFNEKARRRQLIERLQRGEILALISDAGMPGISDPGSELVKACVEENVKVFPIPGPSAALTALVASGLPTNEFLFVGFLPAHASSRRRRLSVSAKESATQIFYVPPHKLCRVLDDFISTFGASRRCAIAREMTKFHEEFWRSTLEEAKVEFEMRQPRGELTLVVEGHLERAGVQQVTKEELMSRLENLMDAGKTPLEASKLVVEEMSARRNVVYSLALEIRKRWK